MSARKSGRRDIRRERRRGHGCWDHLLLAPLWCWIAEQRARGCTIVAVELAEGAIVLSRLEPPKQRTVILLGHEWHGIPEEHVEAADVCVEKEAWRKRS